MTPVMVHDEHVPGCLICGQPLSRPSGSIDAERLAQLRDEYQRFYDFVGDSDPALVDAWHFTQNARARLTDEAAG